MKLKSAFIFSFLFLTISTFYGQITGTVKDENGEALPYVSVYVKNTSVGTTTNLDGEYSLKLDKNTYEIIFQYVGYKTENHTIKISGDKIEKNIVLKPENYKLEQIVITANSEDPAYEIIRKAQAKRKYYKQLITSYECDAYVRGFNKILNAPEKIFGVKIGDIDGALDSTRQGVVYLSESVSKLYYHKGEQKELMYSSKISGNDQGYSFNSAKEMTFDFYSNTIDLNRKLISPISSGAMSYYNYKLEGAHLDENGQLVNKIKVIPKNDYSACFYGHIYINEDLWNINSLELGVTSKSTQLAFIDSLTFKQTFVALGKEEWMPFSNVIRFKMKALGFVFAGNFAAVYSNYLLNAVDENVFGSEVFKVEKEANERTVEYWENLRPIPLTLEEQKDYIKKDSIQKVRESPEYLDSIDKKNNKFGILKLITGYSYQNSKNRTKYIFDAPIANISVNTIEGWGGDLKLFFEKSFNKNNTRTLIAGVRTSYGFSEKIWRPEAVMAYKANQTNNLHFELKGGKSISQINRVEPISDRLNSIMTYFFRRNYLKAYDKEYLSVEVGRDLGNIFGGQVSFNYENRNPLSNHYSSSLFYSDSRTFTDNIPGFDNHQALILRASLRIKLGEKIWAYPDQKFKVGSDWPTIWLNYKKGIKTLGSDISFDLIYATISKAYSPGSIGSMSFFVNGGKFLKQSNQLLLDNYHFLGNQTHIGNPATYNNRFLLLPYYSNSTDEQFVQVHLEYNFKGFLLSRIPIIKQLGWHLALGYKYLDSSDNPAYFEHHIGIDNLGVKIFRLFRVDFVWSNQNGIAAQQPKNTFGVVVGLKMGI